MHQHVLTPDVHQYMLKCIYAPTVLYMHQKVLYHMSAYAHLTNAQADVRTHQLALMTCSCMLLGQLFSIANFSSQGIDQASKKAKRQQSTIKQRDDADTNHSQYPARAFMDIYSIQCMLPQYW